MLQKAVNDALNVSESDVIAAKGSKGPVCPGQEPSTPTTNRSVIPSVPATLVGEIAACLSKQLTTLLVRQIVSYKNDEFDYFIFFFPAKITNFIFTEWDQTSGRR